ncbi:MAG: hypothetical protein K5Q00_06715, partial [Gammaproteobacteria bacterium]|nr:hypothetical protein [Gammaproteobacteria bacterium]
SKIIDIVFPGYLIVFVTDRGTFMCGVDNYSSADNMKQKVATPQKISFPDDAKIVKVVIIDPVLYYFSDNEIFCSTMRFGDKPKRLLSKTNLLNPGNIEAYCFYLRYKRFMEDKPIYWKTSDNKITTQPDKHPGCKPVYCNADFISSTITLLKPEFLLALLTKIQKKPYASQMQDFPAVANASVFLDYIASIPKYLSILSNAKIDNMSVLDYVRKKLPASIYYQLSYLLSRKPHIVIENNAAADTSPVEPDAIAAADQNIDIFYRALNVLNYEQLQEQLELFFSRCNLAEYTAFIECMSMHLRTREHRDLRTLVNQKMIKSPQFAQWGYEKLMHDLPIAWVIKNQPGQELLVQEYYPPIPALRADSLSDWQTRNRQGQTTVFLPPREQDAEPVYLNATFLYTAIKYLDHTSFVKLLEKIIGNGNCKYAFVTILTNAPDARYVMEAVIQQERRHVNRLIGYVPVASLKVQIAASHQHYKILQRTVRRGARALELEQKDIIDYLTAWETFEKNAQQFPQLTAILG